MSSPLVKITEDIYVRKSEVMCVHRSGESQFTHIKLKHGVSIMVHDLTPKEVMDKIEGLNISEPQSYLLGDL